MASPFPGMDPYLEAPQFWPGFHTDLAAETQAALNRVIRPRYIADIATHETYDEIEIARSHAPLEIPIRLCTVEVRTTGEEQLVTAIEILSPVNKRPSHEAYTEYQRKRRALFRSEVHLIEIDLLRGGTRPPLEEPVPAAPYYVVLSRVERRPWVEVWPIPLQEALPPIPVPLLEPDPDAPLDLGAVIASVYERGAYEDRIDYHEAPPPPPLSPEDAVWVENLLSAPRG